MSAIFVVVFAASLLGAVLISEAVHRTVLSLAVLFLVVGFVVGDGVLGLVTLSPGEPTILYVAEVALFSVLFTDGMRVGVKDLTEAWHLPGRALLLGLPLTVLGTALLGIVVVGLPWTEAFLVGAVLSPTDPLLAAAIVGREEIPDRLRRLLHVESGLNDGLALPIVIVLLSVAGARTEASPGGLAGQLALGVAVGVAVPWVAIRLERTRLFGAAESHQPLLPLAVGLLVLAICLLTHANLFLAAFAAGVTIATMSPVARDAFQEFGELVTEVLKLTALMAFGALLSPRLLGGPGLSGYLFALLALVAVRPVALAIALHGSGLSRLEFAAAAWFGPKGFASVVLGLIVLGAGLGRSEQLFSLIALVVVASIIAHSSTDVLVAHAFHRAEARSGAGRDPP
jgi:NhaP-type Na+/H+ or K+/H+ antiporter